jgi:hypothetical protein
MATRNNRPDRLDVYLVSFVTWSRKEGEECERRRDLDERWFGASGPSEAAAHAVRGARESCWLGWIVESVEVVATRYVCTMERCALCWKLRGTEGGRGSCASVEDCPARTAGDVRSGARARTTTTRRKEASGTYRTVRPEGGARHARRRAMREERGRPVDPAFRRLLRTTDEKGRN